jgi:hypothetical protein
MLITLQSYLDSILGSDVTGDSFDSDQLEDGLGRLEDAALILVNGCGYLLDGPEQLEVARMARLPLSKHLQAMGRQLLQHRRMADTMVSHAAAVLQRVWRQRQAEHSRAVLQQGAQ